MLIKAGVPVHFGDGSSFLSEPPFAIVSHMLNLWLRPEDRTVLSDLLSEAYGWSKTQISSLLSSLNSSKEDLFGDNPLSNAADGLQKDIEGLRTVYQRLSVSLSGTTGEKEGFHPSPRGRGTYRSPDILKQSVKLVCNHFLPDDTLSEADLLKKETLLSLAEETGSDIHTFLEQMQLNPYTDAGRLKTDGINLLTFHAAKGLEFPVVFIAGAEEGIAPVLREDSDPEEERRLFYVAMTRAKKELHIIHTQGRARFGEIQPMEASRFLSEIPETVTDLSGGSSPQKTTDHREQLRLF